MNFHELVRSRYSTRGFLDTPVPYDVMNRILDTAILAPSAANKQPWRIHVVQSPSRLAALAETYPRDWVSQAPVLVVFTGVTGTNWVRSDDADYLMSDVTIIADHFILAAAEEGLSTCWIAAFDPQLVSLALDLPPEETPLIMTPLGYAAENATRPRTRKEIDEVVVRW